LVITGAAALLYFRTVIVINGAVTRAVQRSLKPVRKITNLTSSFMAATSIFGVVFFSALQVSAAEWKFDFVAHPELTNSFSKESGHGITSGLW